MFSAVLLAFREGLEAALVVGLLLGALAQMGDSRGRRSLVWGGVAAAVAASIAVAVALTAIGIELEGAAEQIFEGTTFMLAAIVLTWMIFWMRFQGAQMKGKFEREVRQAITGTGAGWGLFSLAFLAVFREGVETALLLSANAFSSSAQETLTGTAIGLACAVAVGYLIFATTVKLSTREFFRVTSVILILFAAGLVGRGVHEFNEAAIVPEVIEHAWDTSAILPTDTLLGALVRTLFGYNPRPSLTELIAYAGYYLIVLVGSWRFDRIIARRPVPARIT
ncbi:MAG: FTR1 family protein [Chloroflexi bacterium]|nr:FTR1 family protein [Chloroflexota bacterium]